MGWGNAISSSSSTNDVHKNITSEVKEENPLQPWVEKYRPKTMNEISTQTQVVNVLQSTLESQNLPHLLFYGPPGTGKTSTILALAKTLFGPSLFPSRVLELNASDERGINVIREKVKNFARSTAKSVSDGSKRSVPPYKLIILDEADSMTPDAQSALRRTMETYSKTTRFCLICNYVTRIIEPIASRCAKFRFTPLPSNAIKERLEYIASQENLVFTPNSMEIILKNCEGDLRKAITLVQSASYRSTRIDEQSLLEVSCSVSEDLLNGLLGCWLNPSVSVSEVQHEVQRMIWSGIPIPQVLSALFQTMLNELTWSSMLKSHLSILFARVEAHLNHGADAFLQLMDLMLQGKKICYEHLLEQKK
ncbi:hypothetical protein HMI54_015501 [Coelomomyces lativittatus]|nr:hypothetical protein HMI56_001813 [Coelomomyces lativittatus]KAJ1512769.1 hypothetical protein HMI54_015501 [Coelomomyces lativittatus]KAJ1517429.1 hypothetical protein HMI55_007084 [Coelomomyces lativittatus]